MDLLAQFYTAVFGLQEVHALHSEHFRGLQIGPTILGFSRAETAYDLLELQRPAADAVGARTFITFEVEHEHEVDDRFAVAMAAGGTAVQSAHRTYYGAWQAVALDPEGNAFRINHLPELHTG